VHFQEWWVRRHAEPTAHEFVFLGAEEAKPAPGVVDAIADADVVLLPPSNPVVSIGAILQVPGIRDTLIRTRAPVVGVSPIVGGAPVRGMADACLSAIGVETSAGAVAEHYGARVAGGLLDGWLIDDGDATTVAPLGVHLRARPLLMTDIDASAEIAGAALDLARQIGMHGA
jgi:LPPG:FO 2-phospho-L-lactate transferase